MFEKTTSTEFKNRAHIGKYTEIVFDTYVMEKGKEEVETINTTLHYVEGGEGEPLIMLHNVGTSIYVFRKMFTELAEHFHVYAVDLPGHGFSEAPLINFTIEEISLSIEAFMDGLNISKAHFVTFGESAAYALDFALHNKQRIGRMIFISPHIIENDTKGTIFLPMASWAGKFMFSRGSFAGEITELFFDRTMVNDEIIDEYYDQFADKEFKSVLKYYSSSYDDAEIKEHIYEIGKPMLVIKGNDDYITPPLKEGLGGYPLRNMRTFTVRNCGYMIPEEKPERINDAIIEFITATEI